MGKKKESAADPAEKPDGSAEEGISAEDIDTVQQQLDRRAAGGPVRKKVTTVENFEGQELDEPLPDEDSMSDAQIKTIRQIRNTDIQDIVELIGNDQFEGYKITVVRKGPPVFKGHNVHYMKIYESKIPQTWDELEDLICARHGGGSYLVRIMCRKGKARKNLTVSFEGLPKLQEQECPSMFVNKPDPEPTTPSEPAEPAAPSRVSQLQEEITIAQLEKQLTHVKGKEDPDTGDDRIDALESKLDRLIDSLEKGDRKPDFPWAIIIPAVISMLQSNNTNALEAARLAADRDKESNSRMLEVALSRNQPEKDNTLEIISTIYSMVQGGSANTMEVFKALLPHMMDGQEANPWVEVFKMMGNMFDKGLDTFKTAAEVKRLRELKERRAARGLPASGQAADAKTEAATDQPASAESTAEASPHDLYVSGDAKRKFQLVFYYLLRDAEKMTAAPEAVFTQLVVLEQSPHQVVDWFLTLKNVEELKGRVAQWPDKEVYKIFDKKIFADSERYLWLTRCIRYLQQYYDVQYAEMETMPEKIRCILTHLVRESEGMRGPEDTLFCSLVLSDETPIELTAFIIASENAEGLQRNLAGIVDADDMKRLDESLFANAEKCEWMGECIEYITSMFSEDDFDDEAGAEAQGVDGPQSEGAGEGPGEDAGASARAGSAEGQTGVDISGQDPIKPTPAREQAPAKKAAPKKRSPAKKKGTAKRSAPKKKPPKKRAAKKKAAPKKRRTTRKK